MLDVSFKREYVLCFFVEGRFVTMSVYIIAEVGVNHNGSLELAKKLVESAAEAGADAVKFQTFHAEQLASASAQKAAYQKEKTDAGESQVDMLRKLELPLDAYPELIALCKGKGVDFLSTPFETDSLRFLVEECHISNIKIPSGEITNGPFLLEIARTGLPVILSTGMSMLGEVETALSVLAYGYLHDDVPNGSGDFVRAYGEAQKRGILREKVSLLHCTTEYPAPFDEVNLAAMKTMEHAFGLTVGYSDHTEGIAIPMAAAARGAEIIEKHFTLDKTLPGPDHKASLSPDELAEMIRGIRQIENVIGNGYKAPTLREEANLVVVRKSLVAKRAIREGEIFSADNLAVKRPASGTNPMRYWELLGKRASCDYEADELIQE